VKEAEPNALGVRTEGSELDAPAQMKLEVEQMQMPDR